MKTCRGCGELKPETAFGINRAMKDNLQPKCRTCIRNQKKALRERHVDVPQEKVCRQCEESLPSSAFSTHSESPDKLQATCKRCARDYQLMYRYGITQTRYAELLAHQDGRCAICEVEEFLSGKAFAVDHDHACCPTRRSCGRCIRALLCWNCNHTLGVMREDPDVYRRAIDYIERTRQTQFR